MKFSRFLWKTLQILLIVTITGGLAACQKAEQPLHYGGQLYADELLLQGLNVWDAYGDNVEHVLYRNPDDLVTAFEKGVADVALFSDIQAARIFEEMGDKALIIAVAESGDRVSTIVQRDSGIESWADLAGKKVALRSGSGAELVLKRYFSLHPELDWNAIEWVNLPVEDMPPALAAGAIDALTATEPIPAIAQAAGGMQVLQSYGDCCQSPLVLVTTRSYARHNKEKLITLLRGQLDKVALIRSDAALAARTASAQATVYGLNVPASAYHIVFMRVDFDLGMNAAVISALQDSAADLVAAGQLTEAPKFYSDDQYLLAAQDAANP
jgi:ABC-type nitrate/sulfonate/bicarbonate transport system substrate-binding protein